MLEDLWNGVIDLSEQFVVPDWGALVGLIPVGLAVLVVFYLSWTVFRLATAGPTRRGVRRMDPLPPAGVHMPGPSFAPLFAAFGAFMLLFGLVAGGPWLWVGLIVLVATLLYWGREALRDYDHLPDVAGGHGAVGALPAPAERRPPPGVHMPPPSFRPILISIAMTMLMAGLVVGGWAAVLGFVAVVLTGLGWLRDARREYVAVEAADRTGHLDLGGPPAWPVATFATLAVVIAVGLLISSGLLPNAGGDAGASAAPGASAPAGGGAPGSAPPSLPAADASIAAENIAFTAATITVPAGRDFTLAFENRDQVPHNVEIKDASGGVLFYGEIFTGPDVRVYEVPALAAGEYPFICSVHPNMTGTIIAQ